MLTELSRYGKHRERLIGAEHTIETHDTYDNKQIKKEYTFSYGKYGDNWSFHMYKEYEKDGTEWKETNKIIWNSPEGLDFTLPRVVRKQMEVIMPKDQVEKFK